MSRGYFPLEGRYKATPKGEFKWREAGPTHHLESLNDEGALNDEHEGVLNHEQEGALNDVGALNDQGALNDEHEGAPAAALDDQHEGQ